MYVSSALLICTQMYVSVHTYTAYVVYVIYKWFCYSDAPIIGQIFEIGLSATFLQHR